MVARWILLAALLMAGAVAAHIMNRSSSELRRASLCACAALAVVSVFWMVFSPAMQDGFLLAGALTLVGIPLCIFVALAAPLMLRRYRQGAHCRASGDESAPECFPSDAPIPDDAIVADVYTPVMASGAEAEDEAFAGVDVAQVADDSPSSAFCDPAPTPAPVSDMMPAVRVSDNYVPLSMLRPSPSGRNSGLARELFAEDEPPVSADSGEQPSTQPAQEAEEAIAASAWADAVESAQAVVERKQRLVEVQAAEEARRLAEEERHAAEEAQRIVEEERRAAEAERREAEKRRIAEEKRAIEERRAAEERERAAAEERQREEQQRIAEERARLARAARARYEAQRDKALAFKEKGAVELALALLDDAVGQAPDAACEHDARFERISCLVDLKRYEAARTEVDDFMHHANHIKRSEKQKLSVLNALIDERIGR